MKELVGKNIVRLRKERRMTQEELSDRLGVTRQMIGQYEAGTAKVSAGRLFDLSRIFGCDLQDFFRGEGK